MTTKTTTLWLGLLLFDVSAAWAAPPALTAADFARKPRFESAKISPGGEFMAVAMQAEDRVSIGILDLANRKINATLAFSHGESIGDYDWVGPRRIVVSLATWYGPLDQPALTGELYGMDADGSNKAYLFGYRGAENVGHLPRGQAEKEYASAFVLDAISLAPQKVLVGVQSWHDAADRAVQQLRTIDVANGRSDTLGTLPLFAPFDVAFDGKGRAILAMGIDRKGAFSLMSSKPESEELSPLPVGESPIHRGAIVGTAQDASAVFYTLDEDSDRICLRRFDRQSGRTAAVSCDTRVDVAEALLSADRSAPLAVRYEDGLPRTVYLQEETSEAKALKALERSFEGQRVRITSRTADGSKMVVRVDSDRNPGDWYLFDVAKRDAEYIMSAREWIDPERMRPQKPIRYTTRDGKTVDGYLTLPVLSDPKQRVPLVLMPHGGPHGVRDYWKWDGWGQWLASRGFGVLQVNFRGSAGYGAEHQSAGYRNWGTTMQDDLADAVKWAVDAGVADAGRVCIVGASYGGYAALMNAVRYPELYRCAASLAGIYDLASQVADSDIDKRYVGRLYLQDVLGRDEKALREQSPITHLDALKASVFIAHGTADERVPFSQAKKLRAALEARKVKFEWHEYDGEAHGFWKDANEADFLQALAAFLERNLAASQAP